MPGAVANDQSFDVAIVGGGIIGLVLATGLIKRNLNVKVYEQARCFREIGAGVAFTANTMRCMNLLDPQIVEGLKRASTSNKDPNNPDNALQWVDGYNHDSADPNSTSEKLLFKLVPEAFQGCHRAHLLNELVKLIPEAVVEFNKRLDTCIDRGDDEKLLLNFHDGTTTEVDAVIGCDGVKSRVRELILGEGNPASYPHFSHKVAFRSLIPMDQAEAAVGAYKARNWHMHLGPGVHILHFPVANQTLMNFVAFVTDPRDWPSSEIMTAPATKAEVVEAFADWGPAVRAIMNLLPDELDKWAMFDTYDYPAPTYTCGRVCIAGDAAHASTPHLGAGAGVGIEDALALATVLEKVTSTLQSSTDVVSAKAKALRAAFNAYDAVRRERSQDFVHLSRNICDTFEWANPETGSDTEKCFQEIKARFHKIWYFDIQGMLRDVADEYERQLTTARGWTESKI